MIALFQEFPKSALKLPAYKWWAEAGLERCDAEAVERTETTNTNCSKLTAIITSFGYIKKADFLTSQGSK